MNKRPKSLSFDFTIQRKSKIIRYVFVIFILALNILGLDSINYCLSEKLSVFFCLLLCRANLSNASDLHPIAWALSKALLTTYFAQPFDRTNYVLKQMTQCTSIKNMIYQSLLITDR